MLKIELKIEFIIAVDKVLKKKRREQKKPMLSQPFSFHFSLHLALCLPLNNLSSLSDSVSFVSAIRSCSNVMSCQTCSSLRSYLERKKGEQDYMGKSSYSYHQRLYELLLLMLSLCLNERTAP